MATQLTAEQLNLLKDIFGALNAATPAPALPAPKQPTPSTSNPGYTTAPPTPADLGAYASAILRSQVEANKPAPMETDSSSSSASSLDYPALRNRSKSTDRKRRDQEAWQTAPPRKNQRSRRNNPPVSFNHSDGESFSLTNSKLQDLVLSRPATHPTDADLLTIKPGRRVIVDDTVYHRNSDGLLVVMKRSKHATDLKDTRLNITCSQPTHPRRDINDDSEIIQPSMDTPEFLLRHDRLFVPQQKLPCKQHRGGGTACYCSPAILALHQQAILPPFCLKKEYVLPEDYMPLFCVKSTRNNDEELTINHELFKTNQQRVYRHDHDMKRPVLLQPSPYFLSYRWKERPYLPASALEEPSRRSDLYYSLIDPQTYRDGYECYLVEPSSWTPLEHPMFREPTDIDKLKHWANGLYGAESCLRGIPAASKTYTSTPAPPTTGRCLCYAPPTTLPPPSGT